MTVVFGEPISQIDRSVFEDVSTWGVSSLQGWINSYESVRFVAINDHTAVITGEYNFEQAKKIYPYRALKSVDTKAAEMPPLLSFMSHWRKMKVAKETMLFFPKYIPNY